ncbi:MAG: hypothetical protein QUU85_12360, partial [Candidatus Eisenbacteria bacterium]|nr:hypothetical protein [Candidatus Eisenbacteria bacterium]
MRWILRGPVHPDEPDDPSTVPRLIRRILRGRGFSERERWPEYFEPSLAGLPDPFLLPDLPRGGGRRPPPRPPPP